MKLKRLARAASATGAALFMMAASASAATIINYTTNAAGTAYTSGNFTGSPARTLNSTSGQAATLVFTPNTSSASGVPSNIDLGDFLLTCVTCTTAQTSIFGAFTFDIVVSDTTDGAVGKFTGTSTGGTVSSNSSTISLSWAPATFGPGTFNAISGNFGSTIFDKFSLATLIVAPNSGTPQGDTTIQAQVSSTPEPASLALFGGGLIGIALLRRRKRAQ